MSNWPDPARPGVPLNPERDGWHWVLLPSGETYALWWRVAAADVPVWAYGTRGVSALAFAKSGCTYIGPCLTPAELAAREAAAFKRGVEAMREKARMVAAMEALAASCQAEDAPPDSPSMQWQLGRHDGSARIRDSIRALPVPEDKP